MNCILLNLASIIDANDLMANVFANPNSPGEYVHPTITYHQGVDQMFLADNYLAHFKTDNIDERAFLSIFRLRDECQLLAPYNLN